MWGQNAQNSMCFRTTFHIDCGLLCMTAPVQGDHLSGKPGNVREFGTCQGNVRDVVNSQGIVRGKNLVREKYTNMHSFYANTLNNNTIYLTLTPEVLATVYLNIRISFKNSA